MGILDAGPGSRGRDQVTFRGQEVILQLSTPFTRVLFTTGGQEPMSSSQRAYRLTHLLTSKPPSSNRHLHGRPTDFEKPLLLAYTNRPSKSNYRATYILQPSCVSLANQPLNALESLLLSVLTARLRGSAPGDRHDAELQCQCKLRLLSSPSTIHKNKNQHICSSATCYIRAAKLLEIHHLKLFKTFCSN